MFRILTVKIMQTKQIALDKLDHYFINVDKDVERRKSIEALVKQMMPHAQTSQRVQGHTHHSSSISNCASSHLEAVQLGLTLSELTSTFRPFMVLEDDCQTTNISPDLTLNFPNDSDLLYLGISECSVHPCENRDMPWQPPQRTEVSSISGLYRVWNMLGAHAYVVCSKRFAEKLTQILMKSIDEIIHLDVLLARASHEFNFYAYANPPVFYQSFELGGQQKPTKICWKGNEQVQAENAFVTMDNLGENGRLGNQMFQFAFLFGLRFDHGVEIRLRQDQFSEHRCKLQLGFPNVSFDLLTSKQNNCDEQIHESESMTPIDIPSNINSIGKATNFRGYFQTQDYFANCVQQIKNLFTFQDDVVQLASSTIVNMKGNNGHVIGLHVRMGDNMGAGHTYSQINHIYCQTAVNIIKQKHPQKRLHLLVVTEDLTDMRLFDIVHPASIKGIESFCLQSTTDFQDMCTLSLCDSLIMSCSSFSWWAAYLGSCDRLILCPVPWYNKNVARFDKFDTSRLFLDTWIKLVI